MRHVLGFRTASCARLVVILIPLMPALATAVESLDGYVSMGLQSNVALQQRRISVEQSLAALGRARGAFMPRLSLEARYSRAGGGREITYPAGDMLNPVYSTLNEMLIAQGGEARFPTNIANQTIPFLRAEEHDTKLRATQPLFVPALLHNYQLNSALVDARQAELRAFECQLAAEIRIAYYTWRKAGDVHELLKSTRHLLEENLRVSQSLVTQGKATRDVVFRAEAELAAFDQQQREAQMNERLARAHFNFLLNRPLDTTIELVDQDEPAEVVASIETLEQRALTERGEMHALAAAATAADEGVDLAWSAHLPTVAAAVDYGFQGTQYRFTPDDDYWMVSLVLSWNLFNGFVDHYQQKSAEQQVRKVAAQHRELELSIALAVRRAVELVEVARHAIGSARARAASERQSFALVSKRYALGMAPHIEFLEARDAMTRAEIEHVVARHQLAIERAQLQRILGSR